MERMERRELSTATFLEELSDLVEGHDGHGLGVVADAEGADDGHCHEEVLVEDLAAEDVADGFPDDVVAGTEQCQCVDNDAGHAGDASEPRD